MAETRCGVCGTYQDSEHPTCLHLRGSQAGVLGHADEARAVAARPETARSPDYFRQLGAHGGAKAKTPEGRARMSEIGKKGGATTKGYGSEHFRELGRKGAAALRRRLDAKETRAVLGLPE